MSHTYQRTAINNHYLQSILPFQTISHQKQFTKTKQFYKPEEFIWNNPHRTSKRMYPYYHQYKDNYEKNIKPKVEEQLEIDRSNYEEERIRKLSEIRHQTRTRFHSRQQLRHQMEVRAGSRKKTEGDPPFLKNQKPYSGKATKSSKFMVHYTQLSVTEKAFQKGVGLYDAEVERVKKIFSEQIMENRQKIRDQFKQRRQANELVNSRIKSKTNMYIQT